MHIILISLHKIFSWIFCRNVYDQNTSVTAHNSLVTVTLELYLPNICLLFAIYSGFQSIKIVLSWQANIKLRQRHSHGVKFGLMLILFLNLWTFFWIEAIHYGCLHIFSDFRPSPLSAAVQIWLLPLSLWTQTLSMLQDFSPKIQLQIFIPSTPPPYTSTKRVSRKVKYLLAALIQDKNRERINM